MTGFEPGIPRFKVFASTDRAIAASSTIPSLCFWGVFFGVFFHPMRLRLAYSVGFKLLGLRCSVDDMVYHDTIWYGVILLLRNYYPIVLDNPFFISAVCVCVCVCVFVFVCVCVFVCLCVCVFCMCVYVRVCVYFCVCFVYMCVCVCM